MAHISRKTCYLFPANGIDSIAYTPLIKALEPLSQVIVHRFAPYKNPDLAIPKPLSWEIFSHEMDHAFSKKENLIGIGHSLGATVLLYNALKNPGRFKDIILIEPALFSPAIRYIYQLIQFLKLENIAHPMVRLTHKRRDTFQSKEAVFKRWRAREQFNYLSDEALRYFIDASIVKKNNTYILRFPKAWEAAIYGAMCSLDPFIWANIASTTTRIHVLAGATSNTFLSGARDKLKKYAKQFVTVPSSSHMLPFEQVLECTDLIKRVVKL
ncbi:MAG: alpha/beta hydrolase [bacterium]